MSLLCLIGDAKNNLDFNAKCFHNLTLVEHEEKSKLINRYNFDGLFGL
jgi:hypothetical protein